MSERNDTLPLVYFHRSVLARYRLESHRYTVIEDDMGGRIETIWPSDYDPEARDLPNWRVRFAFRRLVQGDVSVAAFGPDLPRLPEEELQHWRASLLQSPEFADKDAAFQRWCARNLEGSWEVEDGPRFRIEEHILRINALTRKAVGVPLFRWASHPQLTYPAAQNSQAYAQAVLRLYQLVGDGLQPKALQKMARNLEVHLDSPAYTFNSLKQLLPERLHPVVHEPLRDLSMARQQVHHVPSGPPTEMDAFADFHQLLMTVDHALRELLTWLQGTYGLDGGTCLRRERAMDALPSVSGPPKPAFKLGEAKQAEAKTIQRVDFGSQELPEEVGPSEVLILHFTDGSAMAVTIGSNAGNLAGEHEGLSVSDFSTDIMVQWVPPEEGSSHEQSD